MSKIDSRPWQLGSGCPGCSAPLMPAALRCEACAITVDGPVQINEFAQLAGDDLHLLRIFVACEGRIRDMEAALGISYPTVKARLKRLREALGLLAPANAEEERGSAVRAELDDELPDSKSVLSALEAGELEFEAALAKLRNERR